MKRYISLVALLTAIGHIFLPGVKIDAITLALLLMAVLPLLGFIFKSVELPGGLKVEYPALEKASEDAAKVGLLAAPLALSRHWQIDLFAERAHPANLPGRRSDHHRPIP